MQITADMVSGKTEAHLVKLNVAGLNDHCLLHREVISPFKSMQQAAAEQGIDLQVASGFRSYERQLAIWNAKANGQRVLLDSDGNPIDSDNLDDTAKMFAILRWSALPGCSRHHWGTDIDVWDAAAVPSDYQLQLVPEEYVQGGSFSKLTTWLDKYAESFGFLRPYAVDKDGVAPEPWHLSYLPVAQQFEQQMDITFVRKILDNSDLALRESLADHLDGIVDNYLSR